MSEPAKTTQEKLLAQLEGRARRAFPPGRLGANDDGELAFAVGGNKKKQVVFLDYGKPIQWVGMSPQDAIDLATTLIKVARATSDVPLVLTIPG